MVTFDDETGAGHYFACEASDIKSKLWGLGGRPLLEARYRRPAVGVYTNKDCRAIAT